MSGFQKDMDDNQHHEKIQMVFMFFTIKVKKIRFLTWIWFALLQLTEEAQKWKEAFQQSEEKIEELKETVIEVETQKKTLLAQVENMVCPF